MKRFLSASLLASCLGLSIFGASLTALAADMSPAPAPAAAASATPAAPLSDAQKAQIQAVVKDYLMNNGDVIIQAVQSYQAAKSQHEQADAAANIKKDHDKLFNNPGDAVGGNPLGSVTIVQFYDYNCHYCKGVAPTLTQLMHDNKNLRIVYKQFPILGPASTMAAQAVLAANKQGKFMELHDALMQNTGSLSEDRLIEIAKGIKGLDVDKMKKDANSDPIINQIKASLALGEEVGVRGTPGFVIGDQLYPGAMDETGFKDIIAKQTKG